MLMLSEMGACRGIQSSDGSWSYDAYNQTSVIPWVNLTAQSFVQSLPLPNGMVLEHNVVYYTTIIVYHRGVSRDRLTATRRFRNAAVDESVQVMHLFLSEQS